MTQESPERGRGSTVEICSEEAFAPILAEQIEKLVHYDELVRGNRRPRLSRRLLTSVEEDAARVETLLTDYDALYNQTYCCLFEMVGALRSFASAGATVQNIDFRAQKPYLPDPEAHAAFREETGRTARFIDEGVRDLLSAVREEAEQLCGRGPAIPGAGSLMPDAQVQRKLPHTVGAEDAANLESRIAAEAALFLTAHKTLNERSPGRRFDDPEAMQRFVLEVCDEEQSRFFEAKLANIESRYDTFVVNTATEARDPNLRAFRTGVGVALELIRVVARLVHFYERHEDDLRPEAAKARVTRLIDKHRVLERLLNYGLFFAHRFMDACEPYARALLDAYTVTEEVTLAIPEGVMLHARPASLIVKVVAHHGTPVEMRIGSQVCYAGSITQVLMAAGANLGVREVSFRGDHEPVADLKALFEARLGEDGAGSFPPALSYLKR